MARPRKNNAEYFSHDAGMRNNRKIKALRAKHGNNGYVVFCMTLEMLTDADNFTVTLDEVEMELIAADFGFTVVELRDIWNTAKNLRLIDFGNDKLSCPALIERLQPVLDERVRQREKAAKRWLSKDETTPRDNSTEVLPRENDAAAMQSKVKESKVNISEDINRVYSAYPSKCVVQGRSTGKSSKDKEKIKSLLKTHSVDDLISRINTYISDCRKSATYMKNFGTFLNNLPDNQDEESIRTSIESTKPQSNDQEPDIFDELTRQRLTAIS